MSYKVGDRVYLNDPASKGVVYEITVKHGEYYKLKTDVGVRFCREWRIEGLVNGH